MDRYRQWFGVRFEFLLYDVTSTSFEGRADRNPQAQRSYSPTKTRLTFDGAGDFGAGN